MASSLAVGAYLPRPEATIRHLNTVVIRGFHIGTDRKFSSVECVISCYERGFCILAAPCKKTTISVCFIRYSFRLLFRYVLQVKI